MGSSRCAAHPCPNTCQAGHVFKGRVPRFPQAAGGIAFPPPPGGGCGGGRRNFPATEFSGGRLSLRNSWAAIVNRHAYALERFLAAACLCKAGGVHFVQCYAWACRWRQLGAFGLIFVVRKTRVCACVGVCARVCSNVLGGGPVAVEPTCLVASLATRLCTRMVFVSPSATHGQASGAAWAAALLPWG